MGSAGKLALPFGGVIQSADPPPGSPLTVTLDNIGDLVHISVTDKGRGIAPEDLKTIFNDFSRGRMAEHDGGTGLGLASVRHLATLQGGDVWITSELGHGTTVTVELAHAPTAPHLVAVQQTSAV